MATKKGIARRRLKKKSGTKTKTAKKPKVHLGKKKAETKIAQAPVSIPPLPRVEAPAQASVRITVETIRGETAIGDLLVAFPRTREILVRNGLRLEAEDAGDIYMTLEAFSALNGLKSQTLVQELIIVAKEPPPQQAVPQLVAPATA
jgi:hypothetical protein